MIKSIFSFLYKKDESVMTEISEEEYLKIFVKGRKKEEIEVAYRQAWQAKNFEIDNYWKRTNYFWAFQVASFAGYFSVLGSNAYKTNPQVLFFVTCIGFITSLAWTFINQGSKTWQRHWEIHVDMLENEITGPLYKIVTEKKTFSVSKINDIVSRFIVCIWVILSGKYLFEHVTFNYTTPQNIEFQIWAGILVTLYFTGAMYFGHGRGRFGHRNVKFYRRTFSNGNKTTEGQPE
ncbi:MAG: hypothetical protein IM638_04785 [Bacteroidetes bacterium]|nr:hypothetical protein [Bacteroidota bacterium]